MKTFFRIVLGGVVLSFVLGLVSCNSSGTDGMITSGVDPAAFKRVLENDPVFGFIVPPAESKPYVWWHWMNGNVTREGITRDLEAYAEAGIGGGWIFSMGDSFTCDLPEGPAEYMSEEWLELLKFAASEAKRLGLKLGMHNCAGWATMGGPWIEPKDGQQQLASTVTKIDGGRRVEIKLEQPEINLGYYKDIAVFAYPTPKMEDYRVPQWPQKAAQRGSRNMRQPDLKARPVDAAIALKSIVDVSKYMSKDGTLAWDAPAGSWTILRLGHTPTGKENHPAPDAGRGLEVDKLKRDGVDVHWEKGIKPVLDKMGTLAGDSFNNILIDSYEAGLNHWTERMAEEFKKRRGYDPTPYLLTLTGRLVEDGPTTDRFLWDWRQTVSELFADNFYGYFADLCHANGMEFATEPYTSAFEGMAVAAKADLPMGEFWVTRGYSHTLKLAASIAHTNGGNLAGAEAFTASPDVGKWQNYPGSLRSVGDFVWAQGINRFILHASVHQPFDPNLVPGMTFGQWGTHFDRNVTWYKPGSAWFNYIGRSQYLLQFGEFAADVLAFAGQAAPNGAAYIKGLKDAGYDFDSCGTNILYKLKVENGDIVLPCGRRYRMLKMPDTTFQSHEVARKIHELVGAGATVLSPKPLHSPTLSGYPESEQEVLAIAEEVWGDCDGKKATSNSFGKGKVFAGVSTVDVLGQIGVEPVLQLPEGSPKIEWLHRKAPGWDIFFLSNQSGKDIDITAGFLAAGRRPQFFDAEKGTITNAAGWTVDGNHVKAPIYLTVDKSIFVVFRREGMPKSDPYVKAESAKIGGASCRLVIDEFDKTKVRVWDNGTHTLHRASGKTETLEVAGLGGPVELVGPWDVRFQAKRGAPEKTRFDKLIPWNEHSDEGIKYFSGTATYSIKFDVSKDQLGKNKEMWLDLGEVEVIAEVRVNGEDMGVLWHKPFTIEISDALKVGTNVLEVDVTNLWINRLIGDEQHPEDCKLRIEKEGKFPYRGLAEWPEWAMSGKERPVKERITFATWRHWDADDELVRSGLVGPVVLRSAELVEIE